MKEMKQEKVLSPGFRYRYPGLKRENVFFENTKI
jgi:hypothetical protein